MMIEKGIKFEDTTGTLRTAEKLQMIYVQELLSGERLKNGFERPLSPIRIGMDKIRAKTNLGKYLVEFTSSSTLHGLNHMTAPRRHIIERILAALFIIGAFAILIQLSLTFWQRYQDEAIVIVLNHNYRRYTIKKPSIVICPVRRVNEEKFPKVFQKFIFFSMNSNLTEHCLWTLYEKCDMGGPQLMNYTSVEGHMALIRYGLEDTIETRKFFGFISNASYLTLNDTPNFNAVDPKKWLSILNDLKSDIQLHTTSGTKGTWIVTERGLCVTVDNDVSLYSSVDYWQNDNWTVLQSSSQSPSYGYQKHEINNQVRVKEQDVLFSLYYSGDVVNFHEKIYRCERLSMVTIEVMVVEVSSSSHVAELSLRQRKCKFSEEGGLQMWPIYAMNMCRLECRFKQILRLCHCYPHFARPIPGIQTCNATQLKCIGANWAAIDLSNGKAAKECGCIADCNNARYVEASVSMVALKKGSPPDAVMTPAVIFPTDKYKRVQIFGFNDFLASVGGAAGLLLGASIISFVEIFYFATLRSYWFKVETPSLKK